MMTAPASLSTYKTVHDIAREMGVELDTEHAWAVGAAARIAFEELYGHPPYKDLRPKTNGSGSHCFAVYPAPFNDRIRHVISTVGASRARQGVML